MYLTTTGTITAILTRLGRSLLADNSAGFKITGYKFSDDEIDYSLFDGSSPDASNTNILNLPILEACTTEGIAPQRFELETLPSDTLNIAKLDTDLLTPFVDGDASYRQFPDTINYTINWDTLPANKQISFNVRTFYGYDTQYLSNIRGYGYIGGFTQAVNSTMSTDPLASLQYQSQAKITFSITVDFTLKGNGTVLINGTGTSNIGNMASVQTSFKITGSDSGKSQLINITITSPSYNAILTQQQAQLNSPPVLPQIPVITGPTTPTTPATPVTPTVPITPTTPTVAPANVVTPGIDGPWADTAGGSLLGYLTIKAAQDAISQSQASGALGAAYVQSAQWVYNDGSRGTRYRIGISTTNNPNSGGNKLST